MKPVLESGKNGSAVNEVSVGDISPGSSPLGSSSPFVARSYLLALLG